MKGPNAIAIPSQRVFVTGVGSIVPEVLRDALRGTLTAAPTPSPEISAFETAPGAPAWGFEAVEFSIQTELPHVKSFVDRTSAFALAAGKRALSDAGLLEKEPRPGGVEIGCAYGSTLGCLEAMGIFWHKVKATNPKFAPPLPFTHGYANSPSSLLCIDFGLRGASATFTGEKLAGMEALMFAFDQIATGSAKIILVCASDSLTPAAHSHLFATQQLSARGDWTDGIIPGEGGAALVLESEDSAAKRGAKIWAEVEGINFFPLDPKSSVAPMRVATDTRQTAVFSSLPNLHHFGGWIQHLHKPDMPAVAPKYFTGDMLSVSPLLSVVLAAQTIGGSPIIAQKGGPGLPLLNSTSVLESPEFAVATGFDSGRTSRRGHAGEKVNPQRPPQKSP